ncbi:xanthine dehydrogenase family protein subunit M [Bradyrhizobium sp. KBS0727]|uniref:FAD binding domain-containing protein n=1 Tax=unclassified Bradyrhizobium TaxID=2631580 RepID=UPI00110ED19C|nr:MULTISPECIES: xanthine dehydrogenase family protein subunit M [unclassified Bradyrhizobium]QDW40515.1 xanthine dehydrogenase family protein subunit M [Bradyrhizobium sp. KBS0725]QDW47120.1 xanthine dehydrogenase family protein subunit M [Bradyrhizobium sp. KBS0727]
MISFELAEPKTLREAIALLDAEDPEVRPISGGTALMLMMKSGVFRPSRLVSLQKVESEYSRIERGANGSLRIGALANLSQIERSDEVRRVAPVIEKTMRHLSNVRVRNVARLGGNLAHGDPHMDLPPVLSSLGAKAIIVGPSGQREIMIEDLFSGYYETVLDRDELITFVDVPPQAGWSSAYIKCTTRSVDDWPALGIACSLRIEGEIIGDVRLMISAATEKLTRLASTEKVLRGQRVNQATFERAAESALTEAQVIGDSRGSAAYKSELVRVYVRRALQQVAAGVAQ